jgi:hypothetical protein
MARTTLKGTATVDPRPMLKLMSALMITGTLLSGAGCSKEEEVPASTDTPPPPPPPAPTAPPDAATTGSEVVTYPSMITQRGTRRVLQPISVFQAADPKSKELTRLGVGTFVNLKASYGSWTLIDWPSGVGQLAPGWIELRPNDSHLAAATEIDAGVPVATDAGAPADAGAAATDAGTPPPADAGAGTATADAGAKPADAGTASTDAGTASTDAGSPDAGLRRGKIKIRINPPAN